MRLLIYSYFDYPYFPFETLKKLLNYLQKILIDKGNISFQKNLKKYSLNKINLLILDIEFISILC